jgi:hypothetical protein
METTAVKQSSRQDKLSTAERDQLIIRYAPYNVPQKLDHPISLEEGHWGERNDDDVTAAAQWRV